MFLFSCKGGDPRLPSGTSEPPAAAAPSEAPAPAAASGPETFGPKAITEVGFTYDMFSGNEFKLEARVTEITPAGAKVHLEKRLGPMNYTGHTMAGDFALDGDRTAALLEILSRYDLEGYAKLPRRGSSGAPSRSLIVFSGEEQWYVAFDAKFPETLPPQEDVMYMELYNFFNGLIRDLPDWAEVRSPDLEDPRDNPAYAERSVTWFGREVRLVPGTGTLYEDFRGAELDYGEEKWWLLEGFTGAWVLGEERREDATNSAAALTVAEDGSVTLTLDWETWTGELPETRHYLSDIGVKLRAGEWETRYFTIEPQVRESYELLRVYAYPGPVPEKQFDPTDVVLEVQNG